MIFKRWRKIYKTLRRYHAWECFKCGHEMASQIKENVFKCPRCRTIIPFSVMGNRFINECIRHLYQK